MKRHVFVTIAFLCAIWHIGQVIGLLDCDPLCINGGTCTETNRCDCHPNYEGEACEITPCSNKNTNKWVCYNAGNCMPRPGLPKGAECSCLDECPSCFSGDHCEYYDQCKIDFENTGNAPCSDRGVCVNDDTEDGYTCYCEPGIKGKDCEVFDCDPLCINGGTCTETNKCDCHPNYEGEACEISPCDTESTNPWPCYNGGNCISNSGLPNGAECSCPDEFSGDHCEYLDQCKIDFENTGNVPCTDRGVCVNDDTEDGYTCYCKPGFKGKDCEEATCVEYGVNYHGNDITEYPFVHSWQGCGIMCRESKSCEFWTWEMGKKICGLKSSNLGWVEKDNTISGKLSCVSEC